MLPFLWVHGETEEVYRNMVNVIHESGIGAFCVEARPHPGFVQERWWKDMGILLDEAEKLGMKIWILDDKHFPTGYAAGAVEDAPLHLRKRHIVHRSIALKSGEKVNLTLKKLKKFKEKKGLWDYLLMIYGGKIPKKIGCNEVISCVAYNQTQYLDLTSSFKDGRLEWFVPKGDWSIEVCTLTYNSGTHRDYINMLDKDSCKLQIDAVYEPHYEHFKEKFGTVIAGFFSDEPELGNGSYIKWENVLGTEQSLPYSELLAHKLEEKLGRDWKCLLPLLWKNDYDEKVTAKVRYLYMDAVTRLVEECFSKQIGMWCREHGVGYIGHVIEDSNQHARTGTSLGHYFRGLKWQTMAGIDDIGGQVQPGGEDFTNKNIFGNLESGEFYHYALGKLGSSLGEVNPNMNGRTMCEIFGNYGWTEGVNLQKYLIDHFMVRGVNHFVPHAFTCKAYPDRDCPPHFYAQGNHPQYRHFGEIMKYANRICDMISGGKIDAKVGILYHGEAEWCGKCMLMQKPARAIYDKQIDFRFLPGDIFEEREFYRIQITNHLIVNGREHEVLIVPYAQYLSGVVLQGIAELLTKGGRVIFMDGLPEASVTGETLPSNLNKANVLSLSELESELSDYGVVKLDPPNNRIRVMHYLGEKELYYLVNESKQTYYGKIQLQGNKAQKFVQYDAWMNQYEDITPLENWFEITLEPGKSLFLIAHKDINEVEARYMPLKEVFNNKKVRLTKTELKTFTRSVCRSIDYPNFKNTREIYTLEGYEKENPKFSGYIRYDSSINISSIKNVWLEITEAYEGVEVFVNGSSCGIQVVPTYQFELTPYVKVGDNQLTIEVATTLARERGKREGRTGITGKVYLYQEYKEN